MEDMSFGRKWVMIIDIGLIKYRKKGIFQNGLHLIDLFE